MESTPASSRDFFPPDQVAYVEAEATLDADRLAEHLRIAGIVPADGSPLHLSGDLLLDLAAALRLRAWDASGLTAHRNAGLPSGDSAMAGLISLMLHAGQTGTRYPWGHLASRVFAVMLDRFAWSARAELSAEVALEWPDDDGPLVEALAAILYKTRHSPAEDRP